MRSELPEGWRQQTIGAIADITAGVSPPGSSLNDTAEGEPFYQGAKDFGALYPSPRVFTTAPKRYAEAGDVLLSVRAPVGRVNRARDRCVIGRGLMAVRAKPAFAETRFLEYFFRWMEERWGVYESAGSVFTNLSKRGLGAVEIPLPTLSEQRAIAAVLGALDDKIELNRTIVTKVSELVAAAFLEVTLVDSGAVKALKSVLEVVKGVSYRKSDLGGNGPVAMVNLKNVARGGGYSPDGLKPFAGKHKDTQVVLPGEVVVAHTDVTQAGEVIGRAARVTPSPFYSKLVASLDVHIVRPRPNSGLTNEVIYELLRSPNFAAHASGYANGTTVLHLAKEAIPDYECTIPSSTAISKFTRIASALWQRSDSALLETACLEATRDSLLHELISGRLRIQEAENLVEEAL